MYLTYLQERVAAKDRRRELRKANRCINGPKVGNVGLHGVVHGVVYRGGRCERCWNVKVKSDGNHPELEANSP
jgi:hypothetical protein